MSDSKVKVKARKEVEPRKRGSLEIEPTGEVVRRPSPQPLAIALTDYLKMPEEEQDPISDVELDLIEAIECLDEQEQEIEPVGFDAPGKTSRVTRATISPSWIQIRMKNWPRR